MKIPIIMFKGRDIYKNIHITNAARHEMIELHNQTAITLPIIKNLNVAQQMFGLCCLKSAASISNNTYWMSVIRFD